MKEIFISLGSNKGEKLKNILFSILEIKRYIKIFDYSSIYKTKPWGGAEGDDFLNMVIKGFTELDPFEVLRKNQEVERKFGRERKKRYEPRTLDIDILFYEKLIMENEHLTIPHPLIHERNFVLLPLREIDPSYIHPLLKKDINSLIKNEEDVRKVIDKRALRILEVMPKNRGY